MSTAHRPCLVALLSLLLAAYLPQPVSAQAPADGLEPAYHGPHLYFVEDRSRSRIRNALELPLPQDPVTAESYFDYINHDFYAGTPYDQRRFTDPAWLRSAVATVRGYEPAYSLAALVMFVRTGDPEYADVMKEALASYLAFVKEGFAEGRDITPALIHQPENAAVQIMHLREAGAMSPEDEAMVRELFTLLAEKAFSWGGAPSFTRGSHHRAMNEGAIRRLAATWYPDEPDADRWREFAALQWDDWWQYRDLAVNDTGYFWSSLTQALMTAHVLGQTETFTDPQVQPLWERILYEQGPDGAAPPYGVRSSASWNPAAPARIMTLELIARHTRDGRYRWAAQRAFNYFKATGGLEPMEYRHARAADVRYIALAALFADDTIAPVPPDPASRVLHRREIIRLSPAEAQEQYPAGLDCNLDVGPRMMPSKLLFRSGNEPGDLFMLVEAFTRHDPLSPTAIHGLCRHGSALTIMTTEVPDRGGRFNALYLEDLSGEATFAGVRGEAPPDYWTGQPMAGPRGLPLGYAGMETTIEAFTESPLATHGVMRVSNYQGYEVEQTREFFFIKNRFVLVRDVTTFEESFPVRLGPVWNTQNIHPQPGAHWFNCYVHYTDLFDEPLRSPWRNRAWELLVYHSPQPARRLHIVNRTDNPSCVHMPYAVQYAWEGQVDAGQSVQFSHLLIPRTPTRDPYLFVRGGTWADPLDDLVAGTEFLSDTRDLVAARVTAEENREEWVVLNPAGNRADLTSEAAGRRVSTDAQRLYLDLRAEAPAGDAPAEGEEPALQFRPVRVWAEGATFLTLDGAEVFRHPDRRDTTLGAD